MSTPTAVPALPQDLVLPDGAITGETSELIHDLVRSHSHGSDSTLAEDDYRSSLPWWKRPSPLWLLLSMPFTATAFAATLAPKVEIYTELACATHRPEILPAVFAFVGKANPCASDPVVQAAVAKLSAFMTASMGVLTCLTSAWWGSYSDRHGRTAIMGISLIGLLLTDLMFIVVYNFYEDLPGGYWLLLIGPLVEGALGGMLSAVAAANAYFADTTTPVERSRTYSLNLGLLFIGIALGPTLGSLLIQATSKTISVIYASSVVHCLYAIYVWFVIPESLTPKQMQLARAAQEEQLDKDKRNIPHTIAARAAFRARRAARFLEPLAVLAPTRLNNGKGGRNWSLFCLAIGYAFTVSLLGSYSYKFQYAAAVFGWSSKTIGYWLSAVGAARAVYLTIVLPLIIHVLKPKVTAATTTTESEPLLSTTESQTDTHQDHGHSVRFDLWLARVSMLIEFTSYTLMGLIIHPLGFTVFAMMGAFGTGFSPAVHSLAFELYTRGGGRESGKLFGSLSVVQALASQIIGPAVYGFVYIKTVATFPGAIFFVSSASLAIGIVMFTFVRVPSPAVPDIIVTDSDEEADAQN